MSAQMIERFGYIESCAGRATRGVRGFTLIELMVTLVVAAILLSVAVPSFQQFFRDRYISTQSENFLTDLNYARSEATKRSTNVGVCAGTGAGCAAQPLANGWIVFVDVDKDGGWSAGDTALRTQAALVGKNTLVNKGGTATLVMFNSQGMASAGMGSYVICDNRGAAKGREIAITAAGIIRTIRPASACS